MGEACLDPDAGGNGWSGEDLTDRGVVEGVESVALRVVGSEKELELMSARGVCAEETAGDSTISPQSSSSSSLSFSLAFGVEVAGTDGGFVSKTPRAAHGSVGIVVWAVGGEMGDCNGAGVVSLSKSMVVAVLLCEVGSFGRGVRSTDTGRVSCRCNFATVLCLGGATGEETALVSPAASLHGSPPAAGELQLNAAGTSVSSFGTLSLAAIPTGFDTDTVDFFLA
jgi:hypothetical protein